MCFVCGWFFNLKIYEKYPGNSPESETTCSCTSFVLQRKSYASPENVCFTHVCYECKALQVRNNESIQFTFFTIIINTFTVSRHTGGGCSPPLLKTRLVKVRTPLQGRLYSRPPITPTYQSWIVYRRHGVPWRLAARYVAWLLPSFRSTFKGLTSSCQTHPSLVLMFVYRR